MTKNQAKPMHLAASRIVSFLSKSSTGFILLYLAYALLVLGWASSMLDGAVGWAESILVPLLFGSATFLFVVSVLPVLRPSGPAAVRKQRLLVLLMSSAVAIFCLALTEIVLLLSPPQYQDVQKHLQLQIERIGESPRESYRGLSLERRFNMLGWPDQDWDWPSATDAIVFVGDSFLEVRSTKNLASLTEEALDATGPDRQIINLAKGGAGPDYYRFLLQEVALPAAPEHVFLFFYEGNDLFPGFRYRTYEHPVIGATNEALAVLSSDGPIRASVGRMTDRDMRFSSREELMAELGPGLSMIERYLGYFSVYAYAAEGPPRTVRSLTGLIKNLQRGYCAYRRGRPGVPLPDWRGSYSDYERAYELPRGQRLDSIARVISEQYLSRSDHSRTLDVLQSQSSDFIETLTEQPDMIYYLLPAVAHAVLAKKPRQTRGLPPQECDPRSHYLKFIREMNHWTKEAGATMTLVMIPEASFADPSFRSFWLPMIDFSQYFAGKHELYLDLRDTLTQEMPVIDLLQYDLKDSYWLFDGHFNERGNSSVARIVTSYLRGESPAHSPAPAVLGDRSRRLSPN